MANKKVVIIQHYTGIGGSSLAAASVARMLMSIGYDPVIVIPGKDSSFSNYLKKKCIPFIENSPAPINFTYHNASSGIIKAVVKLVLKLRYIKQWQSFITDMSPALVILNSSVESPMIPIIQKLGIPCICFVRETIRYNYSFPVNFFVRHLISRASAVFFLTDFDRHNWHINGCPQYVMYETITTTGLVEKKHSSNKKTIVLYLGGFSYEKGILDILKAFSYIKSGDIELEILGNDGSDFINSNIIKKIIHPVQLYAIIKSKLVVLRLVASGRTINVRGIQENIDEWYSKADIVVFPVTKVHQARPVFEAGFYSLPVIVPDYENFSESVQSNYNGLIYHRRNPKDLAQKIESLSKDCSLRHLLGTNNNRSSVEKHSEENVSLILDNALKQIL